MMSVFRAMVWLVAAASPAKKPVVIILPFAAPSGVQEFADGAADSFSNQLVESKRVRVLERATLDKVIKEHEFNLSGFVDPETVKRKLGKFIAADFTVMGRISAQGDAYVLAARLVNIESGEIEEAKEVPFRDLGSLRVAVKALGQKFLGAITGEPKGASRAEALLATDAKSFYAAADALIAELAQLRTSVDGELGEIDTSQKRVVLENKVGFGEIPLGAKLEVFHDDGEGRKKVGEIYVSGRAANGEAAALAASYLPGTKASGFEMGDKASSRHYKAKIAIASMVDEAADDEALVNKFRSTVIERLGDQELLGTVSYEPIEGFLGEKPNFKELWKKGVDFVVVGKFYGRPQDRRTEFRVYNAFTSKLATTIRFDTAL